MCGVGGELQKLFEKFGENLLLVTYHDTATRTDDNAILFSLLVARSRFALRFVAARSVAVAAAERAARAVEEERERGKCCVAKRFGVGVKAENTYEKAIFIFLLFIIC